MNPAEELENVYSFQRIIENGYQVSVEGKYFSVFKNSSYDKNGILIRSGLRSLREVSIFLDGYESGKFNS